MDFSPYEGEQQTDQTIQYSVWPLQMTTKIIPGSRVTAAFSQGVVMVNRSQTTFTHWSFLVLRSERSRYSGMHASSLDHTVYNRKIINHEGGKHRQGEPAVFPVICDMFVTYKRWLRLAC